MILRCVIFFFLCSQLCGKETVKTYWEEDGMVAVDLEDFEAKKPWKKETELKGFDGKSYYTWRGGNSYGSAGGGTMEFKIIITKPGDYYLNIHNRHQHHDATLENDCYTQMDDGIWVKTFSSKRDVWLWQSTHEWNHKKKIPAMYTLSAGLHVFRISGRSHGFSIDRFHLWHSSLNKKHAQSLSVELSDSDLPSMPEELKDKRLLSYWNSGKLGMVVRECNNRLSKGEDKEATAVIEAIEKFVTKRKGQIEGMKDFSPSFAFEALKQLARTVTYTSFEKELKAEIMAMSRDKSFQMSLQAEKIYLKATETLKKNKEKLIKGKPRPLSKRTIESLVKAAKDIKRYSPDSPLYDDLAMKLEQENVTVE